MVYKSEDADIFWESIGPVGRSRYSADYVDVRWPDIPHSVRQEISREMNYQQGRHNRIRPGSKPGRRYAYDNERQENIRDSKWYNIDTIQRELPRTLNLVYMQLHEMEKYYERLELRVSSEDLANSADYQKRMRRIISNILMQKDLRPLIKKALEEAGEFTNRYFWDRIAARIQRQVHKEYRAEYESLSMSKRKGSKLNTLIMSIIAGAGGVMAGGALRDYLKRQGIQAPEELIQNAMSQVYQQHHRARTKLKFDGINYRIESDDDVVKGVLDNVDNIRPGQEVAFGPLTGQCVSVSGNYAGVLRDGGVVQAPLDTVIQKEDAVCIDGFYLSWDEVSLKQKSLYTNNHRHLAKTWKEFLDVEKSQIRDSIARYEAE